MCSRTTKSNVALILLGLFLGNFTQAQTVEISPVNKATDLDLSGSIIHAINFGNNATPTLSGVTFSQDQSCSEVSTVVTAEGVITNWGVTYPNTGDAELDALLAGLVWRNNTVSRTTFISIGGLQVGALYQLQLIFFTDHTRPMDIVVEGDIVFEGYDPYPVQTSVTPAGGSVVKYLFIAFDEILNIEITPQRNDGSTASAISGLILSAKTKNAFADYGSGTTTKLVSGKATWQINWGQGPWTWSETTGESLLDPNVTGVLDLRTTAPADVNADMLATLPIGGTLTLTAHGNRDDGEVLGTMVLSGTGINVVDLHPARVIVDEESGMFMVPFHPPAPKVAFTLNDATGVFAYIDQIDGCELHLAGSYAAPLIEGLELADNILAALGGNVPLIGGIGAFSLTGQYVPNASKAVQSFCEYGTGVALQIGAGGALWEQAWNGEARDWYECTVPLNAQFLGDDVVGQLETMTAGAPQIDANMVLSFDFQGQMTLSTITPGSRPGTGMGINGQIIGDVDGTFVADLNASRATFDDEGNIVVAFGWGVHDGPDAKITVSEATGIYADIKQVGLWRWYVNGTLTARRLPDLPLQQNILAALEDDTLILGAEEEFVLTGWYYRESE